MAAAGGNDCGAGAAAGVVGEVVGSLAYDNGNGLSRKNSIGLAEVSGALAASLVVDSDDGDSVFAGSRIGRNAAENNALSAKEYMDEQVDNMWLDGDINDKDYQKYKQVRLESDKIEGQALLTVATLGAGSALLQGSKAIGQNLLTAKLASSAINGVASASGGAWGAYVGGGDSGQILNSAGINGLLGVGAGLLPGSNSILSPIVSGMATGGISSYYYTNLTNPNATRLERLNNTIEGVVGGVVVGLTTAAFTPANSGLAGQFIGAQTALPVNMFMGVISNKYDILNISKPNQHE